MSKLSKHWDRSVKDRASSDPGIFPDPQSAKGRPPVLDSADGPDGHRVEHHNRDDGFGSVTTNSQIPVKGTHEFSVHPRFTMPRTPDFSAFRIGHSGSNGHSMGKLPRLNFPEFDGGKSETLAVSL